MGHSQEKDKEMYFFLLFIIPFATFSIFFHESGYKLKEALLPSSAGFFIALITSLFREFFINMEYNPDFSFASVFIHNIAFTVVPSVLITAASFFLSKGSLKDKAVLVVPLLTSFYAVFTPYTTIALGEKKTFFMLFVNPILIIETILAFSAFLKISVLNFEEKNTGGTITALMGAATTLLVQPAMISSWFLKTAVIIPMIATVLMALPAYFIYKFSYKNENSLDNSN